MENENYSKKRLWLIIGAVIVFVIAIVVISLINIIPKLGKVEVNIAYAPFTSKVLINGEPVKNNSKAYIKKGECEITVSLDGFDTLNEQKTIDDNTKYLYGSLYANSEEGTKIATEHLEDYYIVESYAGAEQQEEGERERDGWPIIKKLPIKSSLYTLGYVVEGNEITLTVASSNTYMDLAIEELTKMASQTGDSLAKYNIQFEGFTNYLAEAFVENNESDAVEALKKGFANVDSFRYINGSYEDEYYIAKVSAGYSMEYTLMDYRLVLKKQGEKWVLASKPEPLVTVFNAPDVPIKIANLANNL